MPRLHDLSIGELSRRTGCHIETIRYYERIGLLPEPRRTQARYRLFGEADVARLSFIRRARELGFGLNEVRALLSLARGGERSCAQARDLAAEHLTEVRAKIADLQTMERVLATTIRACARGRQPNCPLIATLSRGARRRA